MLDIQVSTIVFTIINLLVLYVILKKLLFGRINRVLQARGEQINQQFDQAERQQAQAEQLKAEYEKKLTQAQEEAEGIVSQAQMRGKRGYQAIISQAQEDVRQLQNQAQAQNQADREEMIRATRREVAQLAVMAAAKVAQKSLDVESDRAVAEQFLAEAGETR